MARLSHTEVALWSALLIVQITTCVGLAIGLYSSVYHSAAASEASLAPAAIQSDAPAANDEAQIDNLIMYNIALESMLEWDGEVAGHSAEATREVARTLFSVLLISVLIEIGILYLVISSRDLRSENARIAEVIWDLVSRSRSGGIQSADRNTRAPNDLGRVLRVAPWFR